MKLAAESCICRQLFGGSSLVSGGQVKAREVTRPREIKQIIDMTSFRYTSLQAYSLATLGPRG